MAKDRDSEALDADQSKKPQSAHLESGDQPHQQQQASQQPHRSKSQKHLVGGGTGARMHARVPSSKGLHKQTKLTRRHGSLSPDRGSGVAPASHHHRRATSDLKLAQDPSSTNLKKNASNTALKRNRSHAEVGKRTKSTSSLHRSTSNPAVDKLRAPGGSKVQFNLGDDDQDDNPDDDEWVDASTSASPFLSRRSSAVSAGQAANPPTDDEDPPPTSPTPQRQDTSERSPTPGAQSGAHSLPRNTSSHNQYLTSRILSRTAPHGAPPMMSAETVAVRPPSLRQHSPPGSSIGQGPSLAGSPNPLSQARPGSSGKAELTSRFMGHNSQEPGSGVPGDSFMKAANRGGLSRAALDGKAGFSMPQRRQSLGSLSQAPGIDAINARQAAAEDHPSDDDDTGQAARLASRKGDYALPREMNRTQQKLNLQRASSTLEPVHPHPGIPVNIGPAGTAVNAGPLIGPSTYDSRDPRVGKLLERTGMEYLTVRRHLNPVARSIARVMQLPDLQNSRPIPRAGGSHSHPARASDLGGGSGSGSARPDFNNPAQREPGTRDSCMADLISGHHYQHHHHHRHAGSSRQATTAFSGPMGVHSASSSLGSDGGASRMHDRQQGLSGASLVDGVKDAGTVALLRMMWDKNPNMNLSASQD